MFRILFSDPPCPVCQGHCVPYDVVDFHKTCAEERGLFMSLSGIPIYYFLCERCRFVFAPEFGSWSPADFAKFIYNADYAAIDPDFKALRPDTNAQGLLKLLPEARHVRHLDYGGGEGRLASILRAAGWNSTNFDPYAGESRTLPADAKFDLITSFEVFEHEPDPLFLVERLTGLLAESGLIVFSTLLSDTQLHPPKRIDWWYVAPRNGHISIFSNDSLVHLAERFGYRLFGFHEGLHVFAKQVPAWAKHVLPD